MSTKHIVLKAPPEAGDTKNIMESIARALIHDDSDSDFARYVRTKITAYRRQDQKAGRPEYKIEHSEVLHALLERRMLCTYCLKRMSFFPRERGDVFQWTLDRVDNDDGHSMENCEISCLRCNLRKKRRDSDNFKFGMQVKVTKGD